MALKKRKKDISVLPLSVPNVWQFKIVKKEKLLGENRTTKELIALSCESHNLENLRRTMILILAKNAPTSLQIGGRRY